MHFTIINMLITLLNSNKCFMKKYASLFALTSVILLWGGISYSDAFTYHWEIDETPEGSESATIIEPIEITLLDEQIQVPSHSASLALMRKYSVYLGPEWDPGYAYRRITVDIEIHGESHLDAAQSAYIRVFSEKGTFFDLAWMSPVDANGMQVASGHILRGQATLSRYAANGYWGPDAIRIWDAQGNERHESQIDFGWKLYIDNPLADCEAPVYVKNSMRLSLSEATTEAGRAYQVVTAHWKFIEKNGIRNWASGPAE